MNIALVFPPFYFEPMYNMPPLGLINLATVLKTSPHQVRIFDFPLAIRQKTISLGDRIYSECARQVIDFEPDVAAFSVQCTTYPPALRIAEELKKLRPRMKIVFGGHNAGYVDQPTLSKFPYVDAIVRGEGEITFPELISAIEGEVQLKKVDGVTWRFEDRIVRNPDRSLVDDLDTLPLSDYSFVDPLHVYRDVCGIRRSIAILEIGRGCPHHCIYCSQSLMWRRRSRTFSIERLIREMKILSNDFGAECFLLAYDQFTASRNFAEEFCHRVIDSGLNRIPWYCISRLDTVDGPLLKLMREAGCETMCYGIDSGSKITLAFIRKNIDREILFQRVRETTEQGIIPTLSFVIGFPEETKEDLEATLELALKSAISGNANILVQMATTLPGTDLHKNYSGSLVREVDTYFSFGIEFLNGKRLPSDDELINSDAAVFSSFYNLPCPAGDLSKLNLIASYFSIISSLYPRTFLLLSIEMEQPISELFFSLLDCLGKKAHISDYALTPQNFIAGFPDFAGALISQKTTLVRPYVPELLKYETCLIRAGKLGPLSSSFSIDHAGILDSNPSRNENILIEEFTFDIPSLILDFKHGFFPEPSARRPVYLFFRPMQGDVDVREINDFGADFLRLCDGQRHLDAIAGKLYPKYGAGNNREQFAVLCAEAAETMAELMLLIPGAPA